MKTCPTCYSDKIKQTISTLTRILLSAYIFLTFLFFTGRIHYEALLALIPLIFPYVNICLNCNQTFIRISPKWYKASILKVNSLDMYLILISPSILVITLLIAFFPNTGLGRIIYLPFIFLLNSTVIVISLIITRNLNRITYLVSWALIILLTLIFAVIFYPQEYSPHVIKQIWDSVFS